MSQIGWRKIFPGFAYYLQYLTEKKDWVAAFWKIVNWDDVAERYKSVRSLDLVL